jgi:hypothetical protein
MQIDWGLVVDPIKAFAWPAVAVFALYILRRPLAELVAQIAHRAQKFSIYSVSVELATLPALSPPWSIGSEDVRKLTSSYIIDSPSRPLFEELLKPMKADYAVVDLGAGREWLTSRLYIFALLLGTVTGLRAFVFLESVGGIRRRFLGVATPLNIQSALAARYPWLEEAYFRAAAGQYSIRQDSEEPSVSKFSNQAPLLGHTEQWRVINFVQSFLKTIQRTTLPPPEEAGSYRELPPPHDDPQTWERAHWIDGERLERDSAGFLEYAWCHDSPDKPRRVVAEDILRRSGEFVALVDDDRRFVGLIDRCALLDRVWKEREAEKVDSRQSNAS